MLKRIFTALLISLLIAVLASCGTSSGESGNTTSGVDTTSPELTTSADSSADTPSLPQEGKNYVIETDWMTFYFAKRDFDAAEVLPIVEEAERAMADIRAYLGVSYTLDDAKGSRCYFDSSYRDASGAGRSRCVWASKEMFCVSVDHLTHEYTHLVSMCSSDLLYQPQDMFLEGLAQYVQMIFHDKIASGEYIYIQKPTIPTEAGDYQTVARLLRNSGLAQTAENYDKMLVAFAEDQIVQSNVDRSELNRDIYLYYYGQVFVDYCVNNLGGMEKFMGTFCDEVIFSDVYGKSVDEMMNEAVEYNTAFCGG